MFLGKEFEFIILNSCFLFFLHFGVCAGMILLNEVPKLKSQGRKRQGKRTVLKFLFPIFDYHCSNDGCSWSPNGRLFIQFFTVYISVKISRLSL
jgi:hypothetical protein